jgi:uncharacterized protein (DUF58 family)
MSRPSAWLPTLPWQQHGWDADWGLTWSGLSGAVVLLVSLPLALWWPHWWQVVLLMAGLLSAGLLSRRQFRFTTDWLLPEAPQAGRNASLGLRLRCDQDRGPCQLFHPCGLGSSRQPRVILSAATAGDPCRCVWLTRFVDRGRVRLPPAVILWETGLGLFWCRQVASTVAPITVLPLTGRLDGQLTARLEHLMHQGQPDRKPGDDDLLRLRQYQPGDPRRNIAWRASARARQLLVCIRDQPHHQHLALCVDTRCPANRRRRFERLIAAAATLVEHALDQGWTVSLYGSWCPTEGLQGNRTHLLRALACIQAAPPHAKAPPEIPSAICLHIASDLAGHTPRMWNLSQAEDLIHLPPRLPSEPPPARGSQRLRRLRETQV